MPWVVQLQSANWGEASCIALGAYLLGCLATGYYLVRQRTGWDIRAVGSGSVGARNVRRVLGWTGFMLTVVGDFAKGALAVWATLHYTQDDRFAATALLAVVAGHIWPVQLRFHGGKGVATSLGALLALDFHLAVAFGVIFAAGFALTRKTVLPALFAFVCLPLISGYVGQDHGRIAALSLLAALIWLAHRRNLVEEFFRFLEHREVHPKHHPPE
jgi:glycerol-3-phosphate acyltransferase PlsY